MNSRQTFFLSQRLSRRPLDTLNEDLQDALKYLRDCDYQQELLITEDGDIGLAFASRDHLTLLQQHGTLTLLDATHCTNAHSWKLFTLYIRTANG
jgi:hypothetical protein